MSVDDSDSEAEELNIPSQPCESRIPTSVRSRIYRLWSSSKFEYSPLNPTRNEIRLLRLLPDSDIRSIKCTIFHAALDGHPQYGALSYEWGSRKHQKSIFIDGHKVSVTKNLKAALTYLRSGNMMRILWIDALCINQKDIAERNEQVSKMAKIYESAQKVIIWLGKEHHRSSLALSCIRRTNQDMLEGYEPIVQPREIAAILSLAFRTYWSRAWIVQEVFFAGEAVVCCGNEFLDFRQIRSFFSDFLRKEPWPFIAGYDMVSLNHVLASCASMLLLLTSASLKPDVLLEQLGYCKATDPKDHVYAFIGLIPQIQMPSFVDYSLSVQEVYKRTTALLFQAKGIDIILHAAGRTENKYSLPSWVPDFSSGNHGLIPRRNFDGYIPYSAAKDSEAEFSMRDSTVTCKGLVIGELRKLGSPGPSQPPISSVHKNFVETFYRWQEFLQFEFGDEDDFQDAFVRLMTNNRNSWDMLCRDANVVQEEIVLEKPRNRFFIGAHMAVGQMVLPDYPVPQHLKKYATQEPEMNRAIFVLGETDVYMAASSMCYRRLFITDQGNIGLAIPHIAVGDQICVLLGCSCPVILRPRAEGFTLVSSAVIDGLMDGEAMDGLAEGKYELRRFEIH
jgi:hypothetical protein